MSEAANYEKYKKGKRKAKAMIATLDIQVVSYVIFNWAVS